VRARSAQQRLDELLEAVSVPETGEAESAGAPRAGALDVPGVLALQQAGGNAGVSRMLQRQVPLEVDPQELPQPPESWTREEVRPIQRELERLRLYQGVDGQLGPRTEQGLVEAFGGDQWRTMAPDAVLARLAGAQRPRGRGHAMRYAELFKDGVLDLTLGLGYLEETNPETGESALVGLIQEFEQAFDARGFRSDAARAREVMRRAGRGLGSSAFGTFFLKENAMIYTPPAGEPRPIHVIVRLVANPGGDKGAEAGAAFREGMTQGDVSYYSGHGRYGSGPDFDRNFARFTLRNEAGEERVIYDYTELEHELRRRGNPWQVFLREVQSGRLQVDLSNAGNLRLAVRNLHPHEFGAKLMYWAMEQTGTQPLTGEGGQLAEEAAAHPERKYRLMVFDGCRTQDYERNIRSTPGYDRRSTDMIQTRRAVGFEAEVETFMAFMEGIIGQQSAEDVVKGMNAQMAAHETDAAGESAPFVGSGFQDNPLQ